MSNSIQIPQWIKDYHKLKDEIQKVSSLKQNIDFLLRDYGDTGYIDSTDDRMVLQGMAHAIASCDDVIRDLQKRLLVIQQANGYYE